MSMLRMAKSVDTVSGAYFVPLRLIMVPFAPQHSMRRSGAVSIHPEFPVSHDKR
jgi:hypothetical protein